MEKRGQPVKMRQHQTLTDASVFVALLGSFLPWIPPVLQAAASVLCCAYYIGILWGWWKNRPR